MVNIKGNFTKWVKINHNVTVQDEDIHIEKIYIDGERATGITILNQGGLEMFNITETGFKFLMFEPF